MENKNDLNYKLKVSAIIIIGVVIFFNYLFSVMLPFFIGIILSFIFLPIVNFLEKYNVSRGIGTFISIMAVLCSLGGLVYYMIQQLWEQILLLIDNSPEYIEMISVFVGNLVTKIDDILIGIPPILSNAVINLQNNFMEIAISTLSAIDYTYFIRGLPELFINSIVTLIISYFFTKEKDLLKNLYEKYIVIFLGDMVNTTKNQLIKSLWAYAKTQLILMVYIGIICMVALFLLGSKYSVILGIAIAVIDALPIFGSGFFLWPISLYYLLTGKITLAVGYIVLYLFLQILRQILQPKILGDQINLHPLMTLFSMCLGYEFIGFIGLIIAPILVICLKNYIFDYKE